MNFGLGLFGCAGKPSEKSYVQNLPIFKIPGGAYFEIFEGL